MYRVYGRASSSNVQALLWGMEELGQSYERLDYGEGFAPLDAPEFLRLNPHGKIPVLEIAGQTIWETAAILRFLAGRHGADGFWPRDPLARAEVDMWAEWAKHDVAEAFTGPVFWRVVRTPEPRRDPAAITAAIAALEVELAKADDRLAAREFLCGSELSLADIQLGHVLYRYFDIPITRADLPNLRRYADTLEARPAYRRTVMVSYDSLRDTV